MVPAGVHQAQLANETAEAIRKLLLGLTLLNISLIVAPLLVALPPVRQTPGMLVAARAAGKLAPMMSAGLAVIVAIRMWQAPSASTLAILLVAILCAVLSRINLMEWVFAGVRGAETVRIGELHDVDDTDMIIGVVIEGQSRAYPVRYLAYHHMLNDRLGAAALLPTY